MKHLKFFLGIVLFVSSLQAQVGNRVEVKGKIFANASDVEGVTVFNASSNTGTVTNNKGEFTLKIALNDVVKISALQFKEVSITVNQNAIKTRFLGIHLVEQIHKLDAVLLRSGLTGDINADIDNVANIKPVILDMGSTKVDFEYNDDKAFDATVVQNDLKSRISKGELYNGFDVKKISKLIFGKRDKGYKTPEHYFVEQPLELVDVYSHEYISKMFEIPLNQVDEFVAFVDTQDLDKELLKKHNEIKCLQFLYEKSKQFLKSQNAKK